MDLRKVFDQTVRDLKREVNKKVLKVPEIEQKVLDATSNEAWGPHGTTMSEIAQATRNYNDFQMIMGVLWKRLADTGRNWRHVYKSLTIFDYLVAHGADRVIEELRENVYQIQGLVDFQFVEPTGKDQGINVRKKAQSLVSLLNDKDKIREARQKAAANRDKYQGYSSTGIFKPSAFSNTGGRGFNDWDDDRNGYKEPKEEKYRSAFSDDERDEKKEDDIDKSYSKPTSQKKTGKKESSPPAKSLEPPTKGQSVDDDDFDPRGSVPAPRAAEVDLISQLDFFSEPSSVDPFSSKPKPASVSSATDLFASSDPFASADDFGAFTSAASAAPPATSSSAAVDPFGELSGLQFDSSAAHKPLEFNAFPPPQLNAFGDVNKSSSSQAPPSSFDAFGDFQAPHPTSSFEAFTTEVKATASQTSISNTFMEIKTPSQPLSSSASFDAFGDFKSAPAGDAPFGAFTDVKPSAAPAPKPVFETKSSVWADSLASGLIDLTITAPKSSDNGLQSHSSNLGPDWFMDDKALGVSKGSSMGSGLGPDWFVDDKLRAAAGVSTASSHLGGLDFFMDDKAAQSRRSMGSSGFGF